VRLLRRDLRGRAGISMVQLPPCPGLYGRCRIAAVRCGDGIRRYRKQKRGAAAGNRRGLRSRTFQCDPANRLLQVHRGQKAFQMRTDPSSFSFSRME